MMLVPETRASLLLRLCDPRDQSAWETFLQIYQPLIFRLGRRRGVQEADAWEGTQGVLITVAGAICPWESNPEPGSFRGWLSRITRNLVVNFFIQQSRHPRGSGDSDLKRWLDERPDPPGNILLERNVERVLLTDFGLARAADAKHRV